MITPLSKPMPHRLAKRRIAIVLKKQRSEASAFVRKRDDGRCRACKKPGSQAHHLVYRSHGGKDEPRNLVWLCTPCHRDIHAKVLLVTFKPAHPARTVTFTRNRQLGRGGALMAIELLAVTFKGKNYVLDGTLEDGGAIATRHDYRHGECSFAHLFSSGRIMRFNEQIGTRSDLIVTGKARINLAADAFPNVINAFLNGGWR